VSPNGIAGMPDPHNQAKSARPGGAKIPPTGRPQVIRGGRWEGARRSRRIDARSGGANHYRVDVSGSWCAGCWSMRWRAGTGTASRGGCQLAAHGYLAEAWFATRDVRGSNNAGCLSAGLAGAPGHHGQALPRPAGRRGRGPAPRAVGSPPGNGGWVRSSSPPCTAGSCLAASCISAATAGREAPIIGNLACGPSAACSCGWR
jgi:hypothetical protein